LRSGWRATWSETQTLALVEIFGGKKDRSVKVVLKPNRLA
jgi:hypothetical protein